MRHLGLLIILAAPLLFGQMCGTTGPVDSVPADRPAMISSGMYSGVINCSSKMDFIEAEGTESYTDNVQYTYRVTVSENGIPLDRSGVEFHTGSSSIDTQGNTTTAFAVNTVNVDGAKVQVAGNATLTWVYTDTPSITLTGSEVDFYQQTEDGGLDYTATMIVSSSNVSDVSSTLTMQCGGRLYR